MSSHPKLEATVSEVAKLGISFTVSHLGKDGSTKTWSIITTQTLEISGVRSFDVLNRLAHTDDLKVKINGGSLVIEGKN